MDGCWRRRHLLSCYRAISPSGGGLSLEARKSGSPLKELRGLTRSAMLELPSSWARRSQVMVKFQAAGGVNYWNLWKESKAAGLGAHLPCVVLLYHWIPWPQWTLHYTITESCSFAGDSFSKEGNDYPQCNSKVKGASRQAGMACLRRSYERGRICEIKS